MTDTEKTAVLQQFEGMIISHVNRINRKKFLSPEQVEELEQDMRMKVWTSLDKYDPEKSGLSTWVHHSLNLKVSSFLFHYFMDVIKTVDHNSIDFTSLTHSDGEEDKNNLLPSVEDDLSDLSFRMLLSSIPKEKDRSIMYRWCSGWTMREIAEEEGCSWQNIQQTVKKVTAWLRENSERKRSR